MQSESWKFELILQRDKQNYTSICWGGEAIFLPFLSTTTADRVVWPIKTPFTRKTAVSFSADSAKCLQKGHRNLHKSLQVIKSFRNVSLLTLKRLLQKLPWVWDSWNGNSWLGRASCYRPRLGHKLAQIGQSPPVMETNNIDHYGNKYFGSQAGQTLWC